MVSKTCLGLDDIKVLITPKLASICHKNINKTIIPI